MNGSNDAAWRSSPIAGRRLLLAAILLIALGVRLWGIDFGLPYLYHPDEPGYVSIAQTIFKTGDLNPHFFNYPSLFFYLNALAYGPFYLAGRLLGTWQSPAAIAGPILLVGGSGMTPQPATFLLGRGLTLLAGVGSVLLLYLAGRRLTGSRAVGLLAALFLAVSPTAVTHSRFITPDTFVVFFALLSFWAAVGIYRRGEIRDYLLAGVAAGLTASTKYNGVLVVICLVTGHFLRRGWRGWRDPRPYIALGVAAGTFLLTTPYALFDNARFMADMQLEARHYATGHAGTEGNAPAWYLAYLWQTEGPLAIVAAATLLAGLWTRNREVLLAAVFPLAYFAFISNFMVRNDRTLLPLLPFLFLLAAYGLWYAWRGLAARPAAAAYAGAVSAALLLLMLAVPLVRTVGDSVRLTTVDSRETARVWIAGNLPAGARVALESYAPYVDPQRYTVQGLYRLIDHPPQWYVAGNYDYLVFSEGMFARYFAEPDKYAEAIALYDELFATFRPLKIFDDGGYEVRIYQVTP